MEVFDGSKREHDGSGNEDPLMHEVLGIRLSRIMTAIGFSSASMPSTDRHWQHVGRPAKEQQVWEREIANET
ncbi:hypothetical protein [Rhizobium sp. BR 314]|uniref:hypothetical protein n=1 Tax=Rhizobium sp. BR 314 TaxID=3040013 RepID=UPI0039BED7F3